MRAKSIKTSLLPRYLRVSRHKTHGIVYTPSWIVRLILSEVGYSEGALEGGWLLDPACGDGAFLEEAVRLFIQKAQEAGWPPAAISEALSERIWGIDIDEAAVEKARERLTALTQALGLPLPTWRLQKGDAIDPFWMATHRGQFRYVVGNPPYVRIQHLGEARRVHLQKHFQFCQSGSTDLYIAFFEAGLHLLEEGGWLGYITPNTYFYTKTAERFRSYLSQSGYLRKIIDFRDEQVFEKVTTYSAITILQKRPSLAEVSLAEGTLGEIRSLGHVVASALSKDGWTIAPPTILKRLEAIEKRGQPLGKIAQIHVGITTLADELYIFHRPRWQGELAQIRLRDGRCFWVEGRLLRPIVKVSILRSPDEEQDLWLLFPYEKVEGKYQLIPEAALAERFPHAYKYFLAVRERLLLRDKGKPNPYGWYAFGRHQGLDTTWGPKILVPPVVKEPRFIVWKRPEYTYYAGYGIHYEGDLEDLAAQLQSQEMAFYLRYRARCYQGGYYSMAKGFIARFGVCPTTN